MTRARRPAIPTPRLPPLPRVEHGGPVYAELARLGVSPSSLIDFSVNTNPLGASPRALQAMRLVDPAAYPDDESLRLRAALAALHEVRPEEILVGNGSVELIWLLAQAYLGEGDAVLGIGPTFGEYVAATASRRGHYDEVRASAESSFRPDIEGIVEAIRAGRPRLVFLCNPNNPTGAVLDPDQIEQILMSLDDGLLVVDEAYIDLAEGVESALALQRHDPRVVILRSLTKSHGLAGLRLGYVVAAPPIVSVLAAARPPWTVNALAQAAGLAALGDDGHLEAGRQMIRRAKAWLIDGLEQLGLHCVTSRANFWLIGVPDGSLVRRELLPRGLLVRDATSFGLPRHIRLAARPPDQCERLLRALAWLLANGVLDPSVGRRPDRR